MEPIECRPDEDEDIRSKTPTPEDNEPPQVYITTPILLAH